MSTSWTPWPRVEASLDAFDVDAMAAALRRALAEALPPATRPGRVVEDVVRHVLRAQVGPHDEYVPGWAAVAFRDAAARLDAAARPCHGAWFDATAPFGLAWASYLEWRLRHRPPEGAAADVVDRLVADARARHRLLCDLRACFGGLRLPAEPVAREHALAEGLRDACGLVWAFYRGDEGPAQMALVACWLLESQGLEPTDDLADDVAEAFARNPGEWREGGPAREAAAVVLRHERRGAGG